jgi:hypothetical protein
VICVQGVELKRRQTCSKLNHPTVLVLGNDQLDALFLNVFILRLYMFGVHQVGHYPESHQDARSTKHKTPCGTSCTRANDVHVDTKYFINKDLFVCLRLLSTSRYKTFDVITMSFALPFGNCNSEVVV